MHLGVLLDGLEQPLELPLFLPNLLREDLVGILCIVKCALELSDTPIEQYLLAH